MKQLIYLIAGARPNFMKIAPLMRAFEQYVHDYDVKLIHTGQHYDQQMSDVFFQELGIRQPDYFLAVGSGSHAQQTAKIMVGFEELCLANKPDIVIVVGDVNSTLACAIVAKKLHILLVHVEAGLRSGDMAMPEEVNRLVTDVLSDVFFVTEPCAISNLKQEGKPAERIVFVGHVMIDNLFFQLAQLQKLKLDADYKPQQPYAVLTLHRPSNVDDTETLGRLVTAINELSKKITIVFPVHPRTQQHLNNLPLKLSTNVICVPPLPYMPFLNLWKDAVLVLTDSGGLQEETTAMGIPCVTLRENTERPITIEQGSNRLAGTDPVRILQLCEDILQKADNKETSIPPLWDGHASDRIVKWLQENMR